MLFKERLQTLFEPKEVKEAKQIALQEAAFGEERRATGDFLKGDISMEQYRETCDKLYPLTKIDLRALAQALKI